VSSAGLSLARVPPRGVSAAAAAAAAAGGVRGGRLGDDDYGRVPPEGSGRRETAAARGDKMD